ncbi:hypothetical protein V493_01539 [Pseudogymnoascus sp. VKM F-4281 (FW-2241)]|nr:hypothetical protein V493_01539 [Pseudogymnoascus sp. VKM F-4281 (FW-2241)]
MGIGKNQEQQDDPIPRMTPPQNKQRKRITTSVDGDLPRTNGHAGSHSSNSTNRQSSNSSSIAQPETDLGPLAQELRGASEKLSTIQDAIRAITTSCIQHADDITQIPEIREKYDLLKKEVEEKDITIEKLRNTVDVLGERASEKEKAIEGEVAANIADRKTLEEEKVELDQQKRAVVEELEKKRSDLEAEAAKLLSRRAAEQDKKSAAYMKAQEINLEKRKKEQEEQLGNLETEAKKNLETIAELKAQVEKLRLQLKNEAGKSEDIDRAREGYKQDKEQLAEKLENLQKEFSLNSEPLEYYQGEFLDISGAIQDISARYLARDLNKKELTRLPGIISKIDSTFSDVPFSDTETSKQLRIAHAQRVIANAIYKIIWQPFSSDVTTIDSKLSKLLQDIGAAVGSGRSADVWRAVTMRALGSMSAANTELQRNSTQASGTVHTIKSREDKLVESIISVLEPLLGTSDLLQFKADLLQVAKQSVAIWDSAQADERTFTINTTLNQDNKHDWNIAVVDYMSLNSNGSSQGLVPTRRNSTSVFTLFPIITATKSVQLQKEGHGPPGSWPDQDQLQPLHTEVTLVHGGLGLPLESDIVYDGIVEREEFKKMKQEHDEEWEHKYTRKIAEKGHSRNNSVAGNVSGPPSPSESWSMHKLNNHKTGN